MGVAHHQSRETMTDYLRGLLENPHCCLCHKRFERGDYAQGRPNDSPPSRWHRDCNNPKGLPTRER